MITCLRFFDCDKMDEDKKVPRIAEFEDGNVSIPRVGELTLFDNTAYAVEQVLRIYNSKCFIEVYLRAVKTDDIPDAEFTEVEDNAED